MKKPASFNIWMYFTHWLTVHGVGSSSGSWPPTDRDWFCVRMHGGSPAGHTRQTISRCKAPVWLSSICRGFSLFLFSCRGQNERPLWLQTMCSTAACMQDHLRSWLCSFLFPHRSYTWICVCVYVWACACACTWIHTGILQPPFPRVTACLLN